MRTRSFNILLALLISLIFYLNYHHTTQQGTYQDVIRPAGVNLIDGNGYKCDLLENKEMLYPFWGYPIVSALLDNSEGSAIMLLVLQALLAFLSIHFFYKLFGIDKKVIHLFLIIPFVGLMSVKWPDAIAGSLLFFYFFTTVKYLRERKIKYLLMGCLFIAILVNFRSEYFTLPAFTLFMSILPHFKTKRLHLIEFSFVTFIVLLFSLYPWAYRSYDLNEHYMFAATNSGAVSYISLGQLPDNKWNITPIDKTAWDYAANKGESNPYTFKADSMLRKETYRLIEESPLEYAKKSGYNLFSAFRGGVYTGEIANRFISKETREEFDKKVLYANGIKEKYKVVVDEPYEISVPIVIEKLLRFIFIPILAVVILNNFFVFFKRLSPEMKILSGLSFVYLLYKLVLVSLIQYEYRHMNSIYLIIFGNSLLYYLSKKRVI